MPTINRDSLFTTDFDDDVLVANTPGAFILNLGEIGASGVWAEGIFANADRVRVVNLGLIDVSGEDASAIWIVGDGARIANFGSAVTTGTSKPGEGGTPAALAINGDDARIDNFGTISTSGPEGTGVIVSGLNFRIQNYGLISTAGVAAAGIEANGIGGSIWNVGEIQTAHGDGMSTHGFENTIINEGEIHIEDGGGGMVAGGEDNTIINRGEISSSGRGFQGFVIIGDNSSILNSGEVHSSGATGGIGAFLLGDGNVVRNDGSIVLDGATGSGIGNWGSDNQIENYGLIQAEEAITIIFGPVTVINHGTIIGTEKAISGVHGIFVTETVIKVINHGTIIGAVELGFADDIYIAGSSGELDGVLTLNLGNDQVVIERNSGTLVIEDFLAGAGSDDYLDLTDFAFKTMNDVLARASQVDADVSLQLDKHTSVLLENVLLTGLAANDFLI